MAVIGGGDSAVLDALELAEAGSPVTLVHRSPHLTARRDLVERVRSEGRITEMAGWTLDTLVGSDRLQGVEVSNRSTGEHRRLDVGGLVLKLGRRAVRRIWCGTNWISVPTAGSSSTPSSAPRIRGHSPLGTWSRAPMSASQRQSARARSLPAPSSAYLESSPMRPLACQRQRRSSTLLLNRPTRDGEPAIRRGTGHGHGSDPRPPSQQRRAVGSRRRRPRGRRVTMPWLRPRSETLTS